jgi:hypothetical protein
VLVVLVFRDITSGFDWCDNPWYNIYWSRLGEELSIGPLRLRRCELTLVANNEANAGSNLSLEAVI